MSARYHARLYSIERGDIAAQWRVIYRFAGKKIFIDTFGIGEAHAVFEGRRIIAQLMDPVDAYPVEQNAFGMWERDKT